MADEPFTLSSSNLAGGSYDDETGELTIEFVNGGTYTYSGVPPEVVRGLQTATSAGKYFANYIKTHYSYERS
jgi:hypothetical protein